MSVADEPTPQPVFPQEDCLPAFMGHGPFEEDLNVKALSPIALAYVGDAVYELFIRTNFLWPPQRINQYHQAVVAQVRAERQAQYLRQWDASLTEVEKDIVRRGRNAAPKYHRRVDPKIYQQATGFETLVGYLYLVDCPRLFQLLAELKVGQT